MDYLKAGCPDCHSQYSAPYRNSRIYHYSRDARYLYCVMTCNACGRMNRVFNDEDGLLIYTLRGANAEEFCLGEKAPSYIVEDYERALGVLSPNGLTPEQEDLIAAARLELTDHRLQLVIAASRPR